MCSTLLFGVLACSFGTFATWGSAAAVPHGSTADPLPAGYRADIGIPVAVDDGYIYLYGDTIGPDGGMARNSVVLADGTLVAPALRDSAAGWFWPTDAVQLPTGELMVVALEMVEGGELGYEAVDSDVFVVREPSDSASWRFAHHIDDGPWLEAQIQFSDQWPLVFVRDPHSLATMVYSFDPADPTADWELVPTELLPYSHGVFAPVQTDTGWWGMSWEMWNTATLWRADTLDGEWAPVETITTEGVTYDHGLNIVDGQVVYRWSHGSTDAVPSGVEQRILDL